MHLIVDIPQIYSSSKPVLLLKRMGWSMLVGITPRLGISTRFPITFVQFFFREPSEAQKRFHFCIKTYLSVNLGVKKVTTAHLISLCSV